MDEEGVHKGGHEWERTWRAAGGFVPWSVRCKTPEKIHFSKLPFPSPGRKEVRSELGKCND